MRKTSFLLLSLLAALAPGTLPAQRHPMPPNLKLASGIDMRGGPLLRASRVETDAIKVNGTLVTNMSEVVAGAAAGATALQAEADPAWAAVSNAVAAGAAAGATALQTEADPAWAAVSNAVAAGAAAGATALQPVAAGVFFSQLRLYTDGTNLFFVTGASVTNTVTITPVE